MTKNWHRLAELVVLWSLGLGLIVLAGMLFYSSKIAEGSATLTTLPFVINAIRNMGQSEAMSALVHHVGNSVPMNSLPPRPFDAAPFDPANITRPAFGAGDGQEKEM